MFSVADRRRDSNFGYCTPIEVYKPRYQKQNLYHFHTDLNDFFFHLHYTIPHIQAKKF